MKIPTQEGNDACSCPSNENMGIDVHSDAWFLKKVFDLIFYHVFLPISLAQ